MRPMAEQYRLIFKGEMADGQHQAVVKRKLSVLLKQPAESMDALFSGDAVVLRRSADAKTAARFQAAFKQAGARLRVQPLADPSSTAASAPANSATAAQPATPAAAEPAAQPQADASHGMQLLPVGSQLLEHTERQATVVVNIPIDHLTLAEPGARIGVDAGEESAAELNLSFSFELAEDGSWLREAQADAAEPAPVPAPDFGLAEPGAVLLEADSASAGSLVPPDVSHLSLEDAANV